MVSTDKLQDFEDALDPVRQTNTAFDMKILGYGEISTVFTINNGAMAYKRLPVFSCAKEAEEYGLLYKNYNDSLTRIGIHVPESEAYTVRGKNGIYVAYLAQRKLDGNAIGNKVIHHHSEEEVMILFRLVIRELLKVWERNAKNPAFQMGLDAQISNWAVKDYHGKDFKITTETELLFIDTSTPFIRKDRQELLNAELLLLSAPAFIRPLLRKFFLQGILDRYYDFRLVVIDLLANLYKEQLAHLLPNCLKVVNNEIQQHKPLLADVCPITERELLIYYKEDKFIWKLFMAVRKMDRFIQTKLMRKRYEFILPGRIKR
ncbi:DUF6206 family protein [Leptobacterium sp. I13]|uniref:DUF6206 family protein n=1 Tax=Leptobacterium meishanense TaxID=3128904 RepID=UPI0030EF0118